MERKSVFKKPFANKSSATSTLRNEDIFSRSSRSYVSIAEEEEKRALKKAEKAAKRLQDRVEEVAREAHKDKKRRISSSDSSDDSDDPVHRSEEELKTKKGPFARTPTRSPPTSRETQTPSKPRPAVEKRPEHKPDLVELVDGDGDEHQEHPLQVPGESDDDLQITAVTSQHPKLAEPEADGASESDDEFAELARRAREMAKKRREQQNSTTTDSHSRSAQDGYPNGTASITTPAPPLKAPTAEILITSKIPGTDVKVIKRRIDQRMKEVRLAWCSCQQFSDLESQRIVLVFRGSRVFDVDTPRSIGIGVDTFGDVVVEGERDSLGSVDRRIHMEAMYEEDLERLAKERERAQDLELDDAEFEPPPEPQEPQIKIILRARGMEDFKLIVKPVRSFPNSISTRRIGLMRISLPLYHAS